MSDVRDKRPPKYTSSGWSFNTESNPLCEIHKKHTNQKSRSKKTEKMRITNDRSVLLLFKLQTAVRWDRTNVRVNKRTHVRMNVRTHEEMTENVSQISKPNVRCTDSLRYTYDHSNAGHGTRHTTSE